MDADLTREEKGFSFVLICGHQRKSAAKILFGLRRLETAQQPLTGPKCNPGKNEILYNKNSTQHNHLRFPMWNAPKIRFPA
jgi:hypothetical protein